MKCLALLLAILMLPVSAFAETVAVVSGEHDGYTRLVFAVSSDREWTLVFGQDSATLVFPAQNLEFEDDEVFARIPKTRLVSTHAAQGEGTAKYTMMLGCNCEVAAFSYLDAYIVVDITDPPESSIRPPPARHVAPVLNAATLLNDNETPPESVTWAPPRAPYYVSSPHRANYPVQMGGAGFTSTQPPDAPPTVSRTKVIQAAPGVAVEVDQELQDAVDAARNSLLQQLTFAADQGLLDLNGSTPEILQASEPVHESESENPPETIKELADENQVLIQTAIARDALTAHGITNSQSIYCPSSEDLDVASWGSGQDFFEEVSNARRRLLREFDEPDFFEVERLVRTYLRYGFGAEAKSYLLESGQNIAQHSLLLDIAAIADGQTVEVGGPLSQAIGCDGTAGLWALVGTYPAVDAHIGDQSSIIEAFAELPPDIRRLLGPRLASAFLDREFDAPARQVSDILERAPGDHGVEHELVIGNLMLTEGKTPEAGQAYQAIAEENTLVATEALIELAKLGLMYDQPPARHLLTDLGTTAKIWRGTPKGGELRRLEALWMAKQGREAAAIDLLIAEVQHDPVNTDILQTTAEQTLTELSISETLKGNFAEIAHTYAEFISENEESDKLRLEIAKKLVLTGLPDYAIEILHPALQRNEIGATLLTATANMQAFRPEAALLLLNGVAGDAARILRVEAYLGMGDFEQALGQLNQFADVSAAIAMPFWFKGDWAAAVKTNHSAAEIKARFFPVSNGTAQGSDKLSFGDTLSLSALQEFLADSRSRSAELENVLLRQ